MTDYALDALKRKRAEMTGEIALCHARLQQLSTDLEHLDATLRLFAPDFVQESVLPKVFVPPKSWSKRGEMSRAVLSILRVAKGPLSTREIAAMIVDQRGLENDAGILNIMTRRVGHVLRDKRQAGLVRSVEETGLWLQWEIVR
ncbi:hypothetical protein [Sphingobium baderi]|uniref:Uncharacterized protein n=1 Tax=Sphingobium baderi LL03 TaxID=1114964 RepID=T0I9G1_9SPHN|nr:hypothetical protein [Sphingobium baderi]EQB06239.1 hypothetical protein L485_01050 [Sphingobium baderi LL03]KMS62748.1 hypothetical protein V475_06525 [Sphingobium baderi LL03]